jgi:hypothetical protein
MKKDLKIENSQIVFLLISFTIVFGRLLLSRFVQQDVNEPLLSRVPGLAGNEISWTYKVIVFLGGMASAVAGIWILRNLLLRFFSDGITAVTLVLVILGGNYLQLAVFDGSLAHNILFTLFALIVWLTIRWHETPHRKYAISLGLAIGLAILVRPASAVILLVPLLWGVFDKESLQRKWILIRSNYSQLILCFLYLAIVVFLQMLFMNIRSGGFNNPGNAPDEKFRWIAPYLMQVLFSSGKGWLIFAPMMVFPLIGFYFLAERNKAIFFATFLFFLVNLAIVAGWPAWWHGNVPGQPALLESCVILAIPFGYLLQWIASLKLYTRVPFYLVFLFFILLNLFQSWQYIRFMIDPPNMTKEDYFQTHPEKYNMRVLSNYDFEEKDSPFAGSLVTDIVKSGHYAFRMDTEKAFSPGFQSSFAELSKKSPLGIRVTAWIYSKIPFPENPGSLVVTCNHEGLNYRYETISFEKENLKPGQWNKVIMYYLTPESPDPDDIIQVYVWYRGKNELYVDDLKIELSEPKE